MRTVWRRLADEMHSLVEEFALAQGKTACRWFRGWADADRGKPLEGFQQIRAAYEENRALGMIAGSSETLGYAAEALVLHGDLDGAEEQLRQALEIVDTYGERIYLPQLLLTEGRHRARTRPARRRRRVDPPCDHGSASTRSAAGWSCWRSRSSANTRPQQATIIARSAQSSHMWVKA